MNTSSAPSRSSIVRSFSINSILPAIAIRKRFFWLMPGRTGVLVVGVSNLEFFTRKTLLIQPSANRPSLLNHRASALFFVSRFSATYAISNLSSCGRSRVACVLSCRTKHNKHTFFVIFSSVWLQFCRGYEQCWIGFACDEENPPAVRSGEGGHL